MKKKKAIIVGAGIAGIATAIRLNNQGFDVHIYEANSYPGGKLTEITKDGYRFDCGPSLFTMPQFVEELFRISGKNVTAYFEYEKKQVVCNYFYEDGTRFQATADLEAYSQNAENAFGVDATVFKKYFQKSKKKYDLTASLFLEKSLHKLSTYVSIDTIKAISKINSLDINTSLHSLNEKTFKDPRLVQLFDRYATYNGSSPYLTPGIMSMIPHLEQGFGTFFPKGGMHNITMSLFRLAKDIGVQFYLESQVDRIVINERKATGVQIGNHFVESDLVVSNMDVVPTYRKLLKDQKAPEKTLKQQRSSSALIFYWGIKREFPELDLHNIFFSENYKEEFDLIFNNNQISDDPTVYINITSKNEPEDAPKGCENWFVMINVPGNKGQDWDQMIIRARKNILQKVSRLLQTDLASLIKTEEILDPRSIESKTQSYQGSLYGSASNNKFAAFLRHPNFSRNIKNLYFCGGSVHPGGGIPLCLLSGKITSDIIEKEYKNSL